MSRNNITPTIEQAMSLDEVSSRLLLELYFDVSILPGNTATTFAEASYVHMETKRGKTYYVIKFVADETCDITLGTKMYKGMDITRGTLESSQDGKTEKLDIRMTNKDAGFASFVAQIGRFLNFQTAQVKEYFPDFPDEEPAYLFSGKLNNIKMTVTEFQFDIERTLGDYESDAPVMTYNPNCQYIFKGKDGKCGYTGIATTCDKALSTCESLGNLLRFGDILQSHGKW